VSAINGLVARLSALLPRLRDEFADWTIHRSDSGRWLAIRGNVCIRAHNATELRKRIRQYLAETTEDIRGQASPTALDGDGREAPRDER
jgi:hypothetical protein